MSSLSELDRFKIRNGIKKEKEMMVKSRKK